MPRLTIGMATYNDFDGVYFTLQALRLYQDLEDVELLVVDNFGCEHTRRFVEGWSGARYVRHEDVQGTAAPRDLVFREARGDVVLCCDSHVLFPPGVIGRLAQFYREHPDCDDLLQGPLLYDDAQAISTHLDPVWREEFFGTWATDPRGLDPDGEPFEIPMQGLGAFACRRNAWLGFNPRFRGFGGEEGYIHEKFRQAGRRTLCAPWLRWMHRFSRPGGVPYRLTLDDKFRNYMIGHAELGLDLAPIITHFAERLPQEVLAALAVEALWGSTGEAPPSRAEDVPERAPAAEHVAPAELVQPAEAAARAPAVVESVRDVAGRRAIVCFVGDRPHLVQQALALRQSFLHACSPDTDLVMMGPAAALARIPGDVVRIEQRSVDDDPEWRGYCYADSVLCMNGAGAEWLDRYTHVLRTDVDTFITPAWNDFRPSHFTFGPGGYSNDDDVRRRIRDIAAQFGLTHRGLTNVNSTWYGPTDVVRRASAYNAMLMKHIVTAEFPDGRGEWPGWYWGVSLLYAGEIAVNHCAPDARCSDRLDGSNTSREPTSRYAHIHCWHGGEKFSKRAFTAGEYTLADAHDLDLNVARDFCMAMAFRSLGDLHPSIAPLVRAALESSDAHADAAPPAATRMHYRRSRV